MSEAHFMLWQYDSRSLASEQQLSYLVNQKSIVQTFTLKYSELASKVQSHERKIQLMSGSNQAEIQRLLKKTQYIKSSKFEMNALKFFLKF